MRPVSLAACLLASAVLLGPAIAHANHDDSTPVGLRVTVTDVTGNDVTIEVYARGDDSSALPSFRLGSQFFYDHDTTSSNLDRWVTPVPPAIDWGDGSTVLNTAVPYTGYDTGAGESLWRGQFTHTYSSPGGQTIRVFAGHAYAGTGGYTAGSFTAGNPVYRTSPIMYYISYSTYSSTTYTSTGTRFTGSGIVGLSATTTAGAGGGSRGGSFASSGRSRSDNSFCGLLGIEPLLIFPIIALRRRRRARA